MTYVEAASAPLRKTGQIKIHGPAAFEGMRKAGRLAAECLDMLVGEIKPGVSTKKSIGWHTISAWTGAGSAGDPDVPGLPQSHLHVG